MRSKNTLSSIRMALKGRGAFDTTSTETMDVLVEHSLLLDVAIGVFSEIAIELGITGDGGMVGFILEGNGNCDGRGVRLFLMESTRREQTGW